MRCDDDGNAPCARTSCNTPALSSDEVDFVAQVKRESVRIGMPSMAPTWDEEFRFGCTQTVHNTPHLARVTDANTFSRVAQADFTLRSLHCLASFLKTVILKKRMTCRARNMHGLIAFLFHLRTALPSALVYQRNSVPRDSATWRTAFSADTNVTLSCCSGEECRVPVKPGKNSTEPKRHAQTKVAHKFSGMPASCFMTLWKENRQQVSC